MYVSGGKASILNDWVVAKLSKSQG